MQPSRDGVWKMFDQISPTYDRVNRILSLGIDQHWRRKMSRFLPRGEKLALLDCATGTGDQILALMDREKRIARAVGIDWPLARSGPPRPQAGFRHAARARAELFRSVHRLHRARHRLRAGRSAGHGSVRLANGRDERLEGRAHAARVPAPDDPVVGSAGRAVTNVLSRVQEEVSGSEARRLQAAGQVDRAAGGVQLRRLIVGAVTL